LEGKFEAVVSTDILTEYLEILTQKNNPIVGSNVTDLLVNLPNVIKVNSYFNWNLIEKDPSDNKFTDAALAGHADFIVTNDSHFNALKKIEFPTVRTITISEFMEMLT
jgi:uncharacterized protein